MHFKVLLFLICFQDGRTAIFHAAWKGHIEIVQTLIQVKANIDLQDKVTYIYTLYHTPSTTLYGFYVVTEYPYSLGLSNNGLAWCIRYLKVTTNGDNDNTVLFRAENN